MAYGFQLDAAQFAGSGAYGGSGVEGVDPGYGETPYGGEDYHVYTLPEVQVGSDDPESDHHMKVATIAHRRNGKILGERKYAEWEEWAFNYDNLDVEDAEELKVFFLARRFRFLPDVSNESVYEIVHWVETEFYPQSLRGGPLSLQFTIEKAS